MNHYDNPTVQDLIAKQAVEPDKAAREKLLMSIEDIEVQDLSTLPLLQGKQLAVSAKAVKGAGDTLDASFKFRLGALSK